MTEQTLCEQLGATVRPTSKIVPRILDELTDEQEQRLLMAASPPASVEELTERSGLPLDAVASVNQENCMGCGLCQVVCPTEAIAMELTRDEDLVPAA
jgi:ferredoxin